MALMNYTLPFGGIGPVAPNWGTLSTGFQPSPHANAVNGLLYDPAAHQEAHPPLNPEYYPNNPYAPPPTMRQFTRRNNNYLPPHPSVQRTTTKTYHASGYSEHQTPQHQLHTTRTYSESTYSRPPSSASSTTTTLSQPKSTQYFNNNNQHPFSSSTHHKPSTGVNNNNQRNIISNNNSNNNLNTQTTRARPTVNRQRTSSTPFSSSNSNNNNGRTTPSISNNNNRGIGDQDGIPERPGGYVKVQAGQGKNTQNVAVIDYDTDEEDEYFDDTDTDIPGRCYFLCYLNEILFYETRSKESFFKTVLWFLKIWSF